MKNKKPIFPNIDKDFWKSVTENLNYINGTIKIKNIKKGKNTKWRLREQSKKQENRRSHKLRKIKKKSNYIIFYLFVVFWQSSPHRKIKIVTGNAA